MIYNIESSPNLDTLNCIDAHHCVCNICIKSVKYWLPKASYHIARNNIDSSAYRVTGFSEFVHILFKFRNLARIWAKERIIVNLIPIKVIIRNRAQLGKITLDFDIKLFAEIFFRDTACCNSNCSLPCRGATTTAIIPDTIFLLIAKVSMPWPKRISNLRVISWSLIIVLYQEANRGSGCHPLKGA